jgi:hypothetical protein
MKNDKDTRVGVNGRAYNYGYISKNEEDKN